MSCRYIANRPGKWVVWVGYGSSHDSGWVTFRLTMFRSVSACLQQSGLDRVWVEFNLGRVRFGSMFGWMSGRVSIGLGRN